MHNERWYIYRYKHELRYVEYYKNVEKRGLLGVIRKLLFVVHWYMYKHLSWKLHCTIYPNTIGPGFHLFHIGGFIHIGPENIIGQNCTILPGVLLASSKQQRRVIGDNCYFGVGCKVIPAVNIGNNVTIGANTVVTKDIPDDAVVAGVPAKIIKYKNL